MIYYVAVTSAQPPVDLHIETQIFYESKVSGQETKYLGKNYAWF
jgi:hypothetical protein